MGLLTQWQPSSSLDCEPCVYQSPCKDEPKAEDCKSGQLSNDICGCCKICANAEGEICGGEWNEAGSCADHLYCKKDCEDERSLRCFLKEGKCFSKGKPTSPTKRPPLATGYISLI